MCWFLLPPGRQRAPPAASSEALAVRGEHQNTCLGDRSSRVTGVGALDELGVLTNVIKEERKKNIKLTSSQGANSPLLVSPWCRQAMKGKLLPKTLGATLPCLLLPGWRGPEKTLTPPPQSNPFSLRRIFSKARFFFSFKSSKWGMQPTSVRDAE